MELDWFSEEDYTNTSKFNENSVISNEKKKNIDVDDGSQIKTDINIKNCFDLSLEINDKKNLLITMNYLSSVSDFLRKFIRNKSSKFNDFTEITHNTINSTYDLISQPIFQSYYGF